MNKRKLITVGLLVALLLTGALAHSEAKAEEGLTASLEFGYGKVGRVMRVGFQIEGYCTEISAIVQYNPNKLEYDDYNPFWQKSANVIRLERGMIKIKAETNHPVPRRSQVMQLRFMPQRTGEAELTIKDVQAEGGYITRKRHGKFEILR